MCARFTLKSTADELVEYLSLTDEAKEGSVLSALRPRYNIAPAQDVLVLVATRKRRAVGMARWGLIPSWAKDRSVGAMTINARAESLTLKPAFREAYARRRCLVPVSGFYEWRAVGAERQPLYFSPSRSALMTFAGLWERWQGPDGEEVISCTVVTTEANEDVRDVHDRMPVIVAPEAHERWLLGTPDETTPLLRPAAKGTLCSWEVDPRVNRTSFDVPVCVEPYLRLL